MRKLAFITFLALTACAEKPLEHPDYKRGDVVKVNLWDIRFYSRNCEDSGRVIGYVGGSYSPRRYVVSIRCFRDSYVSEDLIWVDSKLNFLDAF